MRVPVSAEDRSGYRFAGWSVTPSVESAGSLFDANAANTIVSVSESHTVSVTAQYEELPPPEEPYSDVTYDLAQVQVAGIKVNPSEGGVILTWTAPVGEGIVEYAVEAKANLTDAMWDRLSSDVCPVIENGEGMLSVSVPLQLLNADGESYKFFRAWTIVETLNSYD